MSYSTAHLIFERYLTKAGLTHKGYSLHALRHTFCQWASQCRYADWVSSTIDGHTSLDVTRRYARLTDKDSGRRVLQSDDYYRKGEIDAITDSIIRYRRFFEEKECLTDTVKNYLHGLKHFVLWLDVPIETVTYKKIGAYIDYLLCKRLKPKTINCYLNGVCQFYHYFSDEEGIQMSTRWRNRISWSCEGASQTSERWADRKSSLIIWKDGGIGLCSWLCSAAAYGWRKWLIFLLVTLILNAECCSSRM